MGCSCLAHWKGTIILGTAASRHPSVGAVNNARLALVGDAVLDVCALTDAYDARPEQGTLSVEGAFPLLCLGSPASASVSLRARRDH